MPGRSKANAPAPLQLVRTYEYLGGPAVEGANIDRTVGEWSQTSTAKGTWQLRRERNGVVLIGVIQSLTRQNGNRRLFFNFSDDYLESGDRLVIKQFVNHGDVLAQDHDFGVVV